MSILLAFRIRKSHSSNLTKYITCQLDPMIHHIVVTRARQYGLKFKLPC